MAALEGRLRLTQTFHQDGDECVEEDLGGQFEERAQGGEALLVLIGHDLRGDWHYVMGQTSDLALGVARHCNDRCS